MQTIIENIKETLSDLPAWAKTLILLSLIGATLAYGYFELNQSDTPTIQQGGNQQGETNTQNNSISL